MKQFRHGDLLIQEIADIPTQAAGDALVGDIVLAWGEATGHAHRIADPVRQRATALTAPDGVRYLVVDAPRGAALSHEEHATITLPQGNYRVIRQVTYTPEEVRVVAD